MAAQPNESLENAGRLIDQHLKADHSYVELSGQLRIASHRKGAVCVQHNTAPSSKTAVEGLVLFNALHILHVCGLKEWAFHFGLV